MATIITKELAEKIAKKLGAKIDTAGAHAIAYIYHGEVLVAHFGIRHGSKKTLGTIMFHRTFTSVRGKRSAWASAQCPGRNGLSA